MGEAEKLRAKRRVIREKIAGERLTWEDIESVIAMGISMTVAMKKDIEDIKARTEVVQDLLNQLREGK
jgi:hypothetical protein